MELAFPFRAHCLLPCDQSTPIDPVRAQYTTGTAQQLPIHLEATMYTLTLPCILILEASVRSSKTIGVVPRCVPEKIGYYFHIARLTFLASLV